MYSKRDPGAAPLCRFATGNVVSGAVLGREDQESHRAVSWSRGRRSPYPRDPSLEQTRGAPRVVSNSREVKNRHGMGGFDHVNGLNDMRMNTCAAHSLSGEVIFGHLSRRYEDVDTDV